MATARIYLYPIWIRLWHSLNALSFLLLIATGISLHFADTENPVIRFNIAVGIHNVTAIICTIGYAFFLLGNRISGNARYYRGWSKEIRHDIWKQLRFYAVGIFKKEKHPYPINEERKFNPLQKLSYVFVMFVGMPLLVISGIGLMFPELIALDLFGLSGLALTDYVHHIVGFVLSIFLVIHLYTCTLGNKPGTLFKSMVTGYHENHE